ncbi:MAG: ATP-dependent zinc metalloprotease FtsH [Candidatus Moranbacteria bacterium]|nr:ATP-dependent zinc metalloprotease FtsH [Candidatus Moranbacteria bacterium]
MNKFIKNIAIAIFAFIVISLLFAMYNNPAGKPREISLSELAQKINNDKVQEILISGNKLEIKSQDQEFKSQKEAETGLSETLVNFGVQKEKLRNIDIKNQDNSGTKFILGTLIPFLFPFILIGLFFWFIMRQAQRGNSQALSFGNSKAKMQDPKNKKNRVTFDDVAGLKEAKVELQEVVEFLKFPKKFQKLGAKIPKGVLLVGPPGCGKTLLAKGVAGEANAPFFHISGSEFVEMFVGVGASRVRDLFKQAKKNAPAIVFIDEIDAVGRQRGAGLGGGHDEREQTLNQILVEMDGFDTKDNVIVIAATNRPDVLDPALLRPGRFDRNVAIDNPDISEREQILKIHARKKPLKKSVNLRKIAERTPGFSGADLMNLMNEGAILTARRGKKLIGMDELIESIEKVMLGPERTTRIITDKEKRITAYHEAGHALIAHSLPNCDPIHKVSIISRGKAAGYTLKLPTHEKYFQTKSDFLDELVVLLAGHTAEKMIFDDVTTGASNDLEKATKIARNLVTKFGMSDLGPIVWGDREDTVFLGKEIHESKNYSEQMASKIDKTINEFIKKAQTKARKILKQNKKKLEKIAKVLLEKETIEREEFEKLLGKKAIVKAS